jgi:hypothetical protein
MSTKLKIANLKEDIIETEIELSRVIKKYFRQLVELEDLRHLQNVIHSFDEKTDSKFFIVRYAERARQQIERFLSVVDLLEK